MTSMQSKTDVREDGDRELVMTREFDAPRDLVFACYTDCEHLMQWWGPREWPLKHCTIDLRVGGKWHYCMVGPAGEEAWAIATYREITPTSRLVYMDYFSDAEGSEIPPETLTTIEFEDLRDGRTRMKTRATFASPEARAEVLAMGMVEGMNETLDRLDEHLAMAKRG
jgi:uncharacterized protein YndB with AHSA1/START domain